MGYGGFRHQAGKVVGGSGDGDIDGVINQDRLGLDAIYIQAKRWKDNPVGRPDLQQFAGMLGIQKAGKGVFITTSTFTPQAKEFVEKSPQKIILIDREMLAELMIDYGVGLYNKTTYTLKDIDLDYFEGE